MANILDELKEDHDKVRKILKHAEALLDAYPKIKEKEETSIIEELAHELIPHAKAEEEVFYKALMEKDKDSLEPYEATEEHHVVLQILKDLKTKKLDVTERAAKLKVTQEMILHHLEEEETEVFKKARKSLSSEELEDLGKEFTDKKKQHVLRK